MGSPSSVRTDLPAVEQEKAKDDQKIRGRVTGDGDTNGNLTTCFVRDIRFAAVAASETTSVNLNLSANTAQHFGLPNNAQVVQPVQGIPPVNQVLTANYQNAITDFFGPDGGRSNVLRILASAFHAISETLANIPIAQADIEGRVRRHTVGRNLVGMDVVEDNHVVLRNLYGHANNEERTPFLEVSTRFIGLALSAPHLNFAPGNQTDNGTQQNPLTATGYLVYCAAMMQNAKHICFGADLCQRLVYLTAPERTGNAVSVVNKPTSTLIVAIQPGANGVNGIGNDLRVAVQNALAAAANLGWDFTRHTITVSELVRGEVAVINNCFPQGSLLLKIECERQGNVADGPRLFNHMFRTADIQVIHNCFVQHFQQGFRYFEAGIVDPNLDHLQIPFNLGAGGMTSCTVVPADLLGLPSARNNADSYHCMLERILPDVNAHIGARGNATVLDVLYPETEQLRQALRQNLQNVDAAALDLVQQNLKREAFFWIDAIADCFRGADEYEQFGLWPLARPNHPPFTTNCAVASRFSADSVRLLAEKHAQTAHYTVLMDSGGNQLVDLGLPLGERRLIFRGFGRLMTHAGEHAIAAIRANQNLGALLGLTDAQGRQTLRDQSTEQIVRRIVSAKIGAAVQELTDDELQILRVNNRQDLTETLTQMCEHVNMDVRDMRSMLMEPRSALMQTLENHIPGPNNESIRRGILEEHMARFLRVF